MISKIRNIVSIGKSLETLNKKVGSYETEVESLSSSMRSFKEEISILRNDVKEVTSTQHEFLKSFREEMKHIKDTREQFSKTVYDFSVLKKEMQKEILQKFDTKLQEELIDHCKELEHSMEKYNNLKDTLHNNGKSFKEATEQMERLKSIASGIKNADFEFSSFAKQLKSAQDDKLALQRKIDSLERLVSRIRRK